MTPTKSSIARVVEGMSARLDAELMSMSESELAADWYWAWEADKSAAWNLYTFSDALEMHKLRCLRWEEAHGGTCCVVERVRDKYLMPRVREFLTVQEAAR